MDEALGTEVWEVREGLAFLPCGQPHAPASEVPILQNQESTDLYLHGILISKNKTRKCQQAVRLIDQILEIDAEDEHALPGSALKSIKTARKKLIQAIQFRKTRREREEKRHGQ